ncbi:MAG TPA: NAD(P)-dependent oxidoreductase [Gemmatimonadales bacterium]|jgi:nucleoside-diphosphate-sugar epimerase|nr:NAD(P)-dependent oxidoreductase [Gemmatimonadales bacterium]
MTVEAGSYRGVRCLVLGAGGFIGRWVARGLVLAGADLVLAVRDPGAAAAVCARWRIRGRVIRTDLADPGRIVALLEEVRPAIVFNLAGYGVDRDEQDPRQAEALNATLPAVLAESLARHQDPTWGGLQLVHAGSALEYGTASGDLDERSVPNPTTLYGRTKLAGTRAVADQAASGRLRAVTARLFTVYGPGEHPGRLLPTLIEAATGTAPIPLTAGTQRRDFTYVEEVAAGLIALGRLPGCEEPVLNLATGCLTAVREFVETAANVLGIPPERLGFGARPTRPEEMEHEPVAVGRLERLLGWTPRIPPAEGVRRTLEFLRGGG